MSKEVMQQALEFCEFVWRDVQMNDYAFEQLEQTIAALRAALAEQKCPCGDRPADQCPGEWEPGCDLGANEKHAKVYEEKELK